MTAPIVFTRHAIERYLQFHMLDQPQATEEDARRLLEAHAHEAVRLSVRTHKGQEQWQIQALGCEIVTKPEGDYHVCLTILPPMRFRGLTPDQAERMVDSIREAAERTARLEREREDLQQQERQAAADVKDRENRNAIILRMQETNSLRMISRVEHDLYASVLKSMRAQLAHDSGVAKLQRQLADVTNQRDELAAQLERLTGGVLDACH